MANIPIWNRNPIGFSDAAKRGRAAWWQSRRPISLLRAFEGVAGLAAEAAAQQKREASGSV
jgi:hypothetical protein